MNKQRLLDAAEVFDSWRVVPRVIVFVYLGLFVWCVVYFARMYFSIAPAERTVELTAFSSVVLTAMAGAFPFVVKIYLDTGRDWDAARRPPVFVNAPTSST